MPCRQDVLRYFFEDIPNATILRVSDNIEKALFSFIGSDVERRLGKSLTGTNYFELIQSKDQRYLKEVMAKMTSENLGSIIHNKYKSQSGLRHDFTVILIPLADKLPCGSRYLLSVSIEDNDATNQAGDTSDYLVQWTDQVEWLSFAGQKKAAEHA